MKNILKLNLEKLNQSIEDTCKSKSRNRQSIKLLAISKQQTSEKIKQLYDLGISAFGESYLIEAQKKQRELSTLQIEWHFIGTIQSNKTKNIALSFDWIHTVDRSKIIERLAEIERSKNLNVLLQVNIDNSQTKSGACIEEISKLAKQIVNTNKLNLRGLMAIPNPISESHLRNSYKNLFNIFNGMRNNFPNERIDTLSMGMTNDYKIAIEEGSTIIRIGSGIFGSRT